VSLSEEKIPLSELLEDMYTYTGKTTQVLWY